MLELAGVREHKLYCLSINHSSEMLSVSEVAHLMNGFEYPELINHTSIPGVVRFRIDRETPCRTTIYDPGIYILAQGKRWFMQAGEKSPYIEGFAT